MDATDAELLAAFARNRNEDAFRELVRRHLGMVFATARRLIGDAHQAEEIAQTVFQLFAEKAGTIDAGQPLAGWFYHVTRHHALHQIRSEGRRRQREQLAVAMNPATESAPPPPMLAELEDALTELPAEERDALVLRFLEDRQLREVGRELGVSEEAARKRVSRALDRLRDVFARRGITASTGAITVALVGQAGVGVPTTLGASITTTVLGGTAVAAATTALITETTVTTMNLFNLKTAAAIVAAAAVTGTTTYLVQEREAERLRVENASLNETHAKLIALAADRGKREAAQTTLTQPNPDVLELARLRNLATLLGAELSAREQELAALKSQLPSEQTKTNLVDYEAIAARIGKVGEPGTEEQVLERRRLDAQFLGMVDLTDTLSEEHKNQLFNYFVGVCEKQFPGYLDGVADTTNGWEGYDGPSYYYRANNRTLVIRYHNDRVPNWRIQWFVVNMDTGHVQPGKSGNFTVPASSLGQLGD